MDRNYQTQTILEGIYLGLVANEEGKRKWMVLLVGEEEYVIKLDKYTRYAIAHEIEVGTALRVWASRKKSSWKVELIMTLPTQPGEAPSRMPSGMPSRIVPTSAPNSPSQANQRHSTPPTVEVLVCGKGTCCKRGSLDVFEALCAAQQEHPDGAIAIRKTGCLKTCKQGPNVRVTGKKGADYHHVRPDQAQSILHRHIQETPPVPASASTGQG